MEKSNKKLIIIGVVAVIVLILIACVVLAISTLGGAAKEIEDQVSSEMGSEEQSCYDQCDEWGGDIAVCKENCDASSSQDSVWNDDEEDVANDNDATFDSWEEMPLAVPEFTDGNFKSGLKGMGSWIVDYENVTDANALQKYADELEVYDWTASYMEITNMITGSKEGYSISVSHDTDTNEVQIIVREV